MTPSEGPQLQACGSTSGVHSGSARHGGSGSQNNPSCSLAKLQQLTNGLENPVSHGHCPTPPSGGMITTPPPGLSSHHPHMTMTPPPTTHSMFQQQSSRGLATPPSGMIFFCFNLFQFNLNIVCILFCNKNI